MFVDDVILMAESADDLQRSLDACYRFFCMCHLQISQPKSNIIVFNRTARTPIQTWTFGPLVLEQVNFYKYLGCVVMANLSSKNNIQHKKGLIEAALATCMAVANNEVLYHIHLEALVQLYNMCMIPIILYGTEMWTDPTFDALEQLQTKCLKRLLRLPTSTPNPATLLEFGNLPMQTLVERRQLVYYRKLKSFPHCLAGKILALQEENLEDNPHSWGFHVHKLLDKYQLVYVDGISKDGWKHLIRNPTKSFGNTLVLQQAAALSKMTKLLEVKSQISQEPYITTLPVYKARLIFKARCRMLNLKNNFRGTNPVLACGICGTELEDDDHIFLRCPGLAELRNEKHIVTRDELFACGTSIERLSCIADFLVNVENKLRKL